MYDKTMGQRDPNMPTAKFPRPSRIGLKNRTGVEVLNALARGIRNQIICTDARSGALRPPNPSSNLATTDSYLAAYLISEAS